MQKIISLFQRNYDGDRLVRDEVVPGAEWVLEGEGTATRKWDGTCVLIDGVTMWKRHEVKPKRFANGYSITPPEGFRPAGDPDPVTGKWSGWLEVNAADPADRWHIEASWNDDAEPADYEDGTYELVGPKIQGNPDQFDTHRLLRHGAEILHHAPRDFDGIRHYLTIDSHIEGIVWHHPDGRMVKIKAKDFGLKRLPVQPTRSNT